MVAVSAWPHQARVGLPLPEWLDPVEAIRQAELLVAQKAAREAQAQPEAKRPTYFRLPLAERIAREHEALRKGEDAIVAAWIKARAPTHGAA